METLSQSNIILDIILLLKLSIIFFLASEGSLNVNQIRMNLLFQNYLFYKKLYNKRQNNYYEIFVIAIGDQRNFFVPKLLYKYLLK